MSETKYDAAVLQQYADDLYGQARMVIFSTAFIYGLVTFGVAFLISSGAEMFKHPNADLTIQPGVLMIALIGAAVGVRVGRTKAFQLKLEAQKILCQRQVELNTRVDAKPDAISRRLDDNEVKQKRWGSIRAKSNACLA